MIISNFSFLFISYNNFNKNLCIQGGGNLVSTLRRSYSLSDLSEPDLTRSNDEVIVL